MAKASPRTLQVHLHGVHAGTVRRLPTGDFEFRYADAYLDRYDRPISLSMPLEGRSVYRGATVEHYLSNLLPDDDRARARLAEGLDVENTPLGLLGEMGMDCAGAVQFTRDGNLEARERILTPASDDEIAQKVRETRAKREDKHAGVGKHSLGGFQAKFTLRRLGDAWFFADGDEPSTHIVKPGVLTDTITQHQALVEHIVMDTAHRAGLDVARTAYIEFAGEPSVVVERYDRLLSDAGELMRLHQEDLCSVLSVSPTDKYEISVSQIVDVITQHSIDADADLRRYAEAVAFNYMVGGADAHAKNYSMLLLDNQVNAMAPLYDIASHYPYETSDMLAMAEARMAMPIGTTTQFGAATPSDWAKFVYALGLDVSATMSRLRSLAETVPGEMDQAIAECGAPPEAIAWVRESRLLDWTTQSCESVIKAHKVMFPALGGNPSGVVQRGRRCGHYMPVAKVPCGRIAGHSGAHARD